MKANTVLIALVLSLATAPFLQAQQIDWENLRKTPSIIS